MAMFIKDIPPYTKQTKNISEVAQKIGNTGFLIPKGGKVKVSSKVEKFCA
jgi:hypothetical protein